MYLMALSQLVVDNCYLHEKAISRGDAEVAKRSKAKLEKKKSLIGICRFGC